MIIGTITNGMTLIEEIERIAKGLPAYKSTQQIDDYIRNIVKENLEGKGKYINAVI